MRTALDPSFAAALSAGVLVPAFFAKLTFASGTYYAWSGYGNIVWNGQTFLGVGQLAEVGKVKESDDVRAEGMTLKLSGIDAALLGDCLNDIVALAPATVWIGLFNQTTGSLIGTPATLFDGVVDVPTISPGTDEISITLNLENRMILLQRASARRYTTADQHISYPDDTSMGWVESLNDQALIWGT